MPSHTGKRAGASLAALLRGETPPAEPFAIVPSFWSDQYDVNLQSFGMPGIATRAVVVDGDCDDACIVEYLDDSGLVGVIGRNRTRDLVQYRKQLLARGQESGGTS